MDENLNNPVDEGIIVNKPTLMKDIDEADRPREKALALGVDHLTDAELMAIIFATGIRGKNVVDLCQEIIDDAGGLYRVTTIPVQELCNKYKGIGKVKAITLMAALHLGARAAKDRVTSANLVINTPDIAYDVMRHRMQYIQHEEFWILLIDRAAHIIKEVQISKGGTGATTVDIQLIFKAAIQELAYAIILYHNHPSGTLRPSVEDDRLTKKIVDGAKLLDLRVNDHIIISSNGYYSYAEQGRL